MGPLICIALTILTHFALVKYGFEWTHGDYAPVPLAAEEFLRGHFSAFYYNMNYGGTTLEFLRALWVKLWVLFTPSDITPGIDLTPIRAHSAFSYVVCPSLFSLASYYLTRAYVSRSAAWFVGAVTAIGLDFLFMQFGNDPYVAYLLLGSAILIWKASAENPFWELPNLKLLLAGALSGLAIYTSRISLLYVAVFFLPWEIFTATLRNLWRMRSSRSQIERWGIRISLFFLGFWAYLEVFGPELGKVSGRMLKVHAQPNFMFGVLTLTLMAAYSHRGWIRSNFTEIARRVSIVSLGFLVGFSPEWIHALHAHGFSAGGSGSLVAFSEAFRAFGILPSSFREIFTASVLEGENLSWTSQGSVLLLTFAGIALILEARRDWNRLRPIVLLSALVLYAFCRMRTYTFANARYLLPILPAIWVALGCYWELARKRGAWIILLALLPVGLHAVHQLSARAERIEQASSQSHLNLGIALIERFRKEKVEVVASDDYWWASNNFTWLAQGNPIFEPPEGPGLRTPEGVERLRVGNTIGVLQSGTVPGRDLSPWKMELIGEAGKLHIFLGRPVH